MPPAPLFAASSIAATWARHAWYGRSLSPRYGLFVTRITLLETDTDAFHAQNGSLTTSPSVGCVPYLSENADWFITTRTVTSCRRGRSKTFVRSMGPYPRSGGTTTCFESPTAIPCTP